MVEVVLDRVSKVYPGGHEAVHDVSLRFAPGEHVVLLGPSGSGKTTILRLVAGLEKPTRGRVLLGGVDASGVAPHLRRVGMVQQRAVLYPHLRVRENLLFGVADPGSLAEVVALLKLEELLDRRPGELSGGQQQRVALARALLRRPGVLLLDEPFGNLDGAFRWEFRQELPLLCRRLAVTMLFVTHEQEEALALAERLVVLEGGRLLQEGPPRQIHDHPASAAVARQVGWPPIDLLPGRLRQRGEDWVLEGDEASLPVPAGCRTWIAHADRPVLVGIRCQHVGPGGTDARMRVVRCESVGGQWRILLALGSWRLTADSPEPAEGEVGVRIDLTRAHLFDAVSGMALVHGATAGS